MIALALWACSPVTTHPAAPFELHGRTMLLLLGSVEPSGGDAVLVVTDDRLNCEDLALRPEGVLGGLATGPGRGLVLEVAYGSRSGADFGDDPLPGTFSGQTQLANSPWRTILASAYRHRTNELLAGSPWFRLDELGTRARGEFSTEFWDGTVNAEVCERGGGIVDCKPDDGAEFQQALVERYCTEWEACSSDACSVSSELTQTLACPTIDEAAAEACLCGRWNCNSAFPGFEFLELPAACVGVCLDAER